MKVNAIKEAQDFSSMKVDELISSLQAFEMSINEKSNKKKKSIIVVSNTEEVESQSDKENNLTNDIALLEKKSTIP